MYEYFIQKKERENFEIFDLPDVELAFDKIETMSFHENLRIKDRDTEILLTAVPSGNSLGGTVWKIEYNRQLIVYAIDINDKPQHVTLPMRMGDLRTPNILISNTFISPIIGKKKANKLH